MTPTVFTLKGRINRISRYGEADRESDTYQEAVLNGYEGTREEWIADIQARIDAGEAVTGAEFNALLDDKISKRFMKG